MRAESVTRSVTDTPWERHADEPAKAFAAFQMYRDMPVMERSLRRLAAQLERATSRIGAWSTKWSWQLRVDAWDREQDRLRQEQAAKDRKAFAQRLAASGALLQPKGLTKVRSYVDRYDRDGNETLAEQLRAGQHLTDTIPLLEAARLIEVGARLEALGRGLPSPGDEATHVTSLQINPIVAALTANPSRTQEVNEHMETLVRLLGTSGEQAWVSDDDDGQDRGEGGCSAGEGEPAAHLAFGLDLSTNWANGRGLVPHTGFSPQRPT